MRHEETVENLNLGSRNGMLRGKRRLKVPLDIHSVPYWESYPGSLLAECQNFPGALPVSGTSVWVNKLKADRPCLVESQSFSLSHFCEDALYAFCFETRSNNLTEFHSCKSLWMCVYASVSNPRHFRIQLSPSFLQLPWIIISTFFYLSESFSDK